MPLDESLPLRSERLSLDDQTKHLLEAVRREYYRSIALGNLPARNNTVEQTRRRRTMRRTPNDGRY